MAWRFVRRGDGLSYDFVPEKDIQFDYPSYRRTDFDVYCRRLPDFGWCVVDPDGRVLSRPIDDAGFGELPPQGAWLSGKGERAYVYDLVEVSDR